MGKFFRALCVLIYAAEIGINIQSKDYDEMVAWGCAMAWVIYSFKDSPKKSS